MRRSTTWRVFTSDTYNRADTAAGVLGVTDGANGGAAGIVYTTVDFQISTNRVRRNTGTAGNQNFTVPVVHTDIRVTHTIPVLPTTTSVMGPIGRFDGTNYYYTRAGSTGEVELLVVNPTPVSLGITSGLGFTAGDALRLTCEGNVISAQRNGVTCLSVIDSSIGAGTMAGGRGSNNSVLRLDDFMVEVK